MKFDKFPKDYFVSIEKWCEVHAYLKNKDDYIDKYGMVMHRLPNNEMVYHNNTCKRVKKRIKKERDQFLIKNKTTAMKIKDIQEW